VERFTGEAKLHYLPLPHTAEAERARTILNRVAFGATPGDVARVAQMGVQNYLEEQLAGTLTEDPIVDWRVNSLDLQEQIRSAPEMTSDLSNEQLLRETAQAALLRAIYSRHQLRETLADFWTNHFNIFALKNNQRELIPIDTETVIRPHIMGKFREMLVASAHSPAMLSYLDNQQNKKGVANENYARELLELHTLGVHSGYTLQDIQEVARCFTGWRLYTGEDFQVNIRQTLQSPFKRFRFDPKIHDAGAKYIPFLNLTIAPNGGQKDGDTVLEQLATHQATARFLAQKLCRKYLGTVSPEIVAKAQNAYLKNDTDIRAMLRPILLDGLRQDIGKHPQFKRPLDFTVSALRALNADTDGGEPLQKHLQAMGQPLYQWPMPDGFPEKAASWTGSLLGRWNFALALVGQEVQGTIIPVMPLLEAFGKITDSERTALMVETILNRPATNPDMKKLITQVEAHIKKAKQGGQKEDRAFGEGVALLIASPAFQWK
jgi:uncharacterized protein (DUF1800 family)